MKRVVFLLMFGAFMMASCEKDPNFSKMDEDFIAYSKYEKGYVFKNKRVYVMDTLTVIGDQDGTKWCNSTSQQIVDRIKNNYKNLGYTIVKPEEVKVNGVFQTDYIVSTIMVKDMETVLYYTDPYWYGYDWYDWYGWWGYYPYYPYYPYVSGYSYTVGTTLIEMLDVSIDPGDSGYPIRWNAVISGMVGTGEDMELELQSIDQVFSQSPYLSVK